MVFSHIFKMKDNDIYTWMFWLLCNFCLSSWSSCGLDRWSSTLVSEIHGHKTHTSADTHTLRKHVEHAVQPVNRHFHFLLVWIQSTKAQQVLCCVLLYCSHFSMLPHSGSQSEATLSLPATWPLATWLHTSGRWVVFDIFASQASGEFGGRSGIWSVGYAHFTSSWAVRWPDRRLISSNKVRTDAPVLSQLTGFAVIKCCYFSMQDTRRSAQGHHCSLSVCTLCVCCEPQPICRL